MRRAFAQTLTTLADEDPRLVFITGDLGFQVLDDFKQKYPKRYINAGVAEAQMISLAAGMAAEGFRPVAYSIASFATARPFEQIRYCIAYHNLPVLLVGAGRGYLYSTSGVSHHAADDLALMSVLPNMTVVAPGDAVELATLLPAILRQGRPAYMSVGKYGEPTYVAEEPPVLGKARRIKSGERLAILSTGELANEVVKALELLRIEGITPLAYQFHTVKPLDLDLLTKLAREMHTIIVLEEHVPVGGLWAQICSFYAERGTSPRLKRLGAPDQFALGNLKQADLRKKLGIDAEALIKICRECWSTI